MNDFTHSWIKKRAEKAESQRNKLAYELMLSKSKLEKVSFVMRCIANNHPDLKKMIDYALEDEK